MERVYQRTRNRSYAQKKAVTRRQTSTKLERFERKLALQFLASLIIFLILWGIQSMGGGVSNFIKNKASYIITYNVDFNEILNKTIKMGKDAAMLLVNQSEEDKKLPESTEETQNQPIDDSISSEDSISLDQTIPASSDFIDTTDTYPQTDGDMLLSE